MSTIGLTGGICSGKSMLASGLSRLLGWQQFDADKEVHRLLESDVHVMRAVSSSFPGVFVNGTLRRDLLRRQMLINPSCRRTLEGILHPRVWSSLESLKETCRRKHRSIVAEIPLLFETESACRFDQTVLVGTSPGVQMRRMMELRKLPEEQAAALLSAQWPVEKKATKADFVLWNDGALDFFQYQIEQFAQLIKPSSGISKS